MKHFTQEPGPQPLWRKPESIAAAAADKALQLEAGSERSGQITILAELVLAIHRCADSLELTNDHLSGISELLESHLHVKK